MKSLPLELADQGIHFFVGACITLLALVFIPGQQMFAGVIIALALGAVREVTEGGNVLSSGSVRDLIGWALGGLFAGFIKGQVLWLTIS